MAVSGVCYWEQLPGQNYHSCVKHMKKINNWMEAGMELELWTDTATVRQALQLFSISGHNSCHPAS